MLWIDPTTGASAFDPIPGAAVVDTSGGGITITGLPDGCAVIITGPYGSWARVQSAGPIAVQIDLAGAYSISVERIGGGYPAGGTVQAEPGTPATGDVVTLSGLMDGIKAEQLATLDAAYAAATSGPVSVGGILFGASAETRDMILASLTVMQSPPDWWEDYSGNSVATNGGALLGQIVTAIRSRIETARATCADRRAALAAATTPAEALAVVW